MNNNTPSSRQDRALSKAKKSGKRSVHQYSSNTGTETLSLTDGNPSREIVLGDLTYEVSIQGPEE